MSDAASHSSHAHGGHQAHRGSRFIQHHFNDAEHQFDSGKFGIWLFLVQEILFFSALFVAYIIYRHQHPEIFIYASHYLDTTMGAINTAVLILSSFTAAYAVRCAQLNQQKLLIGCLTVTLACAFAFLGIKYVEYTHKIHVGTLFGAKFKPCVTPTNERIEYPDPKDAELEAHCRETAVHVTGIEDVSKIPVATEAQKAPPNTGMFFTIYFAMTGLHGIHVLAGVIVFFWLLVRAVKGHFTPDYFGPVDFSALYWHLVDLIWIFLFPLFYLID
jgi:cytochrome c oxidase subunit 3